MSEREERLVAEKAFIKAYLAEHSPGKRDALLREFENSYTEPYYEHYTLDELIEEMGEETQASAALRTQKVGLSYWWPLLESTSRDIAGMQNRIAELEGK